MRLFAMRGWRRAVIAGCVAASALLAGPAAAPGGGASRVHFGTSGWAGYAWYTGSHQVSASLRLPYVYPASNAGAAFWVGFGLGPGIEQAGFTANMVGGRLQWTEWYELYPAPPVAFGWRAYSGNDVSMTVTYRGGGWYTLTVHNATRNWTSSVTRYASHSTLGIAEAVTEAYGPPLAHFSPARFYGLPDSWGWAYSMPWAYASPRSCNSFTVYWR